MRKNYVLASMAGLLFLCVATTESYAQTDLNTRKALYFTGTKTDSIDLKSDVYVANGATVSLSAELRTSCDHSVCEFNVAVIATRTGTGPQSTDVVVQTGKNGEKFLKTFEFATGQKSKEVIFPIKLSLGKNQFTVTIDPNNKTGETDEANNSFSGTVMVSWKRANPGNKN